MKQLVPFLLLTQVFVLPLMAQRTLNLEYKQDQQGNFVFSCTNRGWCPYIVRVDLPTLENARADHAMPYITVVRPGVTRLFKLTQTGGDVKFKYTFGYSKGCLDPPVNTGFTYLLPVAPGKQAQAYEQAVSPATPLRAGDTATTGAADLRSSYSIRFRAKSGDTLYASRRGTVTDVRVSSDENDQGVETTGTANFIEIVHADCSFAQYGVVKKDGALVKPGQFVEAGQPIGIIGGDKFGRGSEARISVRYNRKPDESHDIQGEQQAAWAYVPLKFWTKRNGRGMLTHGATYTSEFPEPIVTQEMSKAELAKWKAKNHPGARTHK
ncbi:MAG: M23 family metallopeptidase [Bacteroidota bacterium]|nr:M23 family metallopeptidase [Bacteroidota bacterium]MDP4215506.1 M23 family metallopeptidase [Bacteroidota bacterium]MDP4246323.1 M23 family metallopeptidase [Bacteroidota bacterium]MDP4253085.1 M23 family metallopeptidase [Bacteroidota bacterium]MDP4259810.1 M23 family metallopeptidase [Bacteroidota bacterium]